MLFRSLSSIVCIPLRFCCSRQLRCSDGGLQVAVDAPAHAGPSQHPVPAWGSPQLTSRLLPVLFEISEASNFCLPARRHCAPGGSRGTCERRATVSRRRTAARLPSPFVALWITNTEGKISIVLGAAQRRTILPLVHPVLVQILELLECLDHVQVLTRRVCQSRAICSTLPARTLTEQTRRRRRSPRAACSPRVSTP